MAAAPSKPNSSAIGRRALLGGGLGVAALSALPIRTIARSGDRAPDAPRTGRRRSPSTGSGIGTFVVMGDTGLLCNNGLRIGSSASGKIALLGNGSTIVRDKGLFKLVCASPGGETIDQTQFQFLVNVIDRGMGIQAGSRRRALPRTPIPAFTNRAWRPLWRWRSASMPRRRRG